MLERSEQNIVYGDLQFNVKVPGGSKESRLIIPVLGHAGILVQNMSVAIFKLLLAGLLND